MTALQTRKPTGLPSWPIILLGGREGAGKSWAAIEASASPLVGRTLYIGIGEDDPDEYALIPGADFEIVEHDGTYPGILAAIRAAVAEPMGDLPTLIVLDSATRLWNLIGDNMQAIANKRAKGRKNAAGEFTISPDLWNVAASQWQDVMDALREHHGPAIITARLDSVTVMENGQPTTQKEWKVQAHKSLVFDATAVLEMHERGHFLITKVKSARVKLEKPKTFPGFTVNTLWTDLGLSEGTAPRTHATVRADRTGTEPGAPAPEQVEPPRQPSKDWLALAAACKSQEELRPIYQEAESLGELNIVVDGQPIGQILWNLRGVLPLKTPAEAPAAEAPADAWAVVDIPTGEETAA